MSNQPPKCGAGDILQLRKEFDCPVKECIDSSSQENLLYYIMGAEANVMNVYYAMDVYREREEKIIFLKFIKCLIINSHIQNHKSVSLRLIQTDLERLQDMNFEHIMEACLMISNSCRYMFNEKARLHWWKATECLPRLAISGIVKMDELTKRFEQIAVDVIEKINDLMYGLATACLPTNTEIISYLEKRFDIKNILPRVVDTKFTIYSKQYDKQRFVSIDVIQSNWTALGILFQMISTSKLSPFEEIVKSVVTDIFKDIFDKSAREWLCTTFINSKILRNYSFNKSRANTSTVAMIVKCIISIAHQSTLYLQGKINDELRLVYSYDELVIRPVCEDEAETNEKFGIALDKLKGIVRYEQYTIHALYNPSNDYIGVCRKFGKKIDLKNVEADNLLHAYEYINSKL